MHAVYCSIKMSRIYFHLRRFSWNLVNRSWPSTLVSHGDPRGRMHRWCTCACAGSSLSSLISPFSHLSSFPHLCHSPKTKSFAWVWSSLLHSFHSNAEIFLTWNYVPLQLELFLGVFWLIWKDFINLLQCAPQHITRCTGMFCSLGVLCHTTQDLTLILPAGHLYWAGWQWPLGEMAPSCLDFEKHTCFFYALLILAMRVHSLHGGYTHAAMSFLSFMCYPMSISTASTQSGLHSYSRRS